MVCGFLQGSTGNDYISGGAGTDWALFELSMASYSIVQIASTILFIGDYVDTVFGDVEWLSFFDQAVRFVDLIEPSQAVSDETRSDFYGDGAEDFLWRNDNGAIFQLRSAAPRSLYAIDPSTFISQT